MVKNVVFALLGVIRLALLDYIDWDEGASVGGQLLVCHWLFGLPGWCLLGRRCLGRRALLALWLGLGLWSGLLLLLLL